MDVKNWIDEWCNLYPDIEVNGYKLKSKPKDCVNKMIKFCKDNPSYSKDHIFAATKNYLADKKQQDFAYTKQSTYFISKIGQPSLLLTYCEKLAETKDDKIYYNEIDNYI